MPGFPVLVQARILEWSAISFSRGSQKDTKKDLMTWIANGVVIHLEPDILECEVKLALGSITANKASGGDGILVELFKILKDDAINVPYSLRQQIWKTQQGYRTGKG